MLKEALQLQKKLKKIKVSVEAGKGLIKVTANGEGNIVDLDIAEELLNPKNKKKLEKLIIEAVKKAKKEVASIVAKEVKLPNIPGF